MSCIVHQTSKWNGIIYAFQFVSYRDSMTKMTKSQGGKKKKLQQSHQRSRQRVGRLTKKKNRSSFLQDGTKSKGKRSRAKGRNERFKKRLSRQRLQPFSFIALFLCLINISKLTENSRKAQFISEPLLLQFCSSNTIINQKHYILSRFLSRNISFIANQALIRAC